MKRRGSGTKTIEFHNLPQTPNRKGIQTINPHLPQTPNRKGIQTINPHLPQTLNRKGMQTINPHLPQTPNSKGIQTINPHLPQTPNRKEIQTINPHLPNGLPHLYQLDESIFIWCTSFIFINWTSPFSSAVLLSFLSYV